MKLGFVFFSLGVRGDEPPGEEQMSMIDPRLGECLEAVTQPPGKGDKVFGQKVEWEEHGGRRCDPVEDRAEVTEAPLPQTLSECQAACASVSDSECSAANFDSSNNKCYKCPAGFGLKDDGASTTVVKPGQCGQGCQASRGGLLERKVASTTNSTMRRAASAANSTMRRAASAANSMSRSMGASCERTELIAGATSTFNNPHGTALSAGTWEWEDYDLGNGDPHEQASSASTCEPKACDGCVGNACYGLQGAERGRDRGGQCRQWCRAHTSPWKNKCGWGSRACSGCSQCDEHRYFCPCVQRREPHLELNPGCASGKQGGIKKKFETFEGNYKLKFKCRGGDRPCAGDYLAYCNAYPDLQNAYCGGGFCFTEAHAASCSSHWLGHGKREARDQCCAGGPIGYCNAHEDLQKDYCGGNHCGEESAAKCNAHWKNLGKSEGREVCNGRVDSGDKVHVSTNSGASWEEYFCPPTGWASAMNMFTTYGPTEIMIFAGVNDCVAIDDVELHKCFRATPRQKAFAKELNYCVEEFKMTLTNEVMSWIDRASRKVIGQNLMAQHKADSLDFTLEAYQELADNAFEKDEAQAPEVADTAAHELEEIDGDILTNEENYKLLTNNAKQKHNDDWSSWEKKRNSLFEAISKYVPDRHTAVGQTQAVFNVQFLKEMTNFEKMFDQATTREGTKMSEWGSKYKLDEKEAQRLEKDAEKGESEADETVDLLLSNDVFHGAGCLVALPIFLLSARDIGTSALLSAIDIGGLLGLLLGLCRKWPQPK
jgi:hypothetical protein